MKSTDNAGKVVPMLLWFRCKNCYSFAEESGITMLASAQKDNTEFIEEKGGLRVLRVASIYGANASGKSNFFKALSSIFWNICGEQRSLSGESFDLDDSLQDAPIECEISICLADTDDTAKKKFIEYKYGYELYKNKVSKEWLVKREAGSKGKFSDIFFREGDKIEFGKGISDAIKPFEKTIEKSDDILFLRLAGRTFEEPFSSIFDWCVSCIPPIAFTEEVKKYYIKEVAKKINTDEEYRKLFLGFLKKFDPCVEDVFSVEENGPGEDYEIRVRHTSLNPREGSDGHRDFSIYKESDGTQKITGIYPLIMGALERGGLAMVDELDTKLHPLVLRELIKIFHDKNWNPYGAQLVFSAHNIVALNSQDMRRDEIYFIEKDRKGCSSISRLSSLETDVGTVRADMDYGKNYLAGRFGAVPAKFVL